MSCMSFNWSALGAVETELQSSLCGVRHFTNGASRQLKLECAEPLYLNLKVVREAHGELDLLTSEHEGRDFS